MEDSVTEVKRATDIVELIGSYVRLKKAGQNYKGLCPFHQEKTPSFMVNPERQIYRCFGCGEGGDAISFLEKIEGMSFIEALQRLANQAGIALPERRFTPEQAIERKEVKTRLLELQQKAAEFYSIILHQTPHGAAAATYLTARGLSKRTIEEWKLGFAPKQRDILLQTFQKKGESIDWLIRAGLVVKEADGSVRDRFINRIIFPLISAMNDVVAFTGRSLEDREGVPKYLNSPETDLFKKSEYLYGLSHAKQLIRTNGRVILVEGQMDVLLSAQAGTKEVVATSGTAVTEQHLELLRRLTDRLILAFDSDSAGAKTRDEVAIRAIRLGFEVKEASLGSHKDPGEFSMAAPDSWVAAVEQALPYVVRRIEELTIVVKNLSAREKSVAARGVLRAIAAVPSPVEREDYLDRLSVGTKISRETLLSEMKSIDRPEPTMISATAVAKSLSADELLAALLIRFPAFLAKLPELPFSDEKLTELMVMIAGKQQLTAELQTSKDLLDFGLEQLLPELDEATAKQEIIGLINRKAETTRKALRARLSQSIKEAEHSGDQGKVADFLAQLQKTLK